jgi:hypothetical protein
MIRIATLLELLVAWILSCYTAKLFYFGILDPLSSDGPKLFKRFSLRRNETIREL